MEICGSIPAINITNWNFFLRAMIAVLSIVPVVVTVGIKPEDVFVQMDWRPAVMRRQVLNGFTQVLFQRL